jgi:hypothetical protein
VFHVGWGTVHDLHDVGVSDGRLRRLVDRLNLDSIDLDDLYIVVVGPLRLTSLDLVVHSCLLHCDIVADVLQSREMNKVVDEPVFI